jgi:hypothetical protein
VGLRARADGCAHFRDGLSGNADCCAHFRDGLSGNLIAKHICVMG